MAGSAAYEGVSVVGALGEGVRLIRRRPLDVLAWGGLLAAFGILALATIGPTYVTEMGSMMAAARSGETATPDFAGLVRLESVSWALSLLQIVLEVVLVCAVWRAVLHPDRSRWAYLRIGGAEVFFFLFFFGASVVAFIGMIALFILVALLVGIGVVAHATALAPVTGGVLVLVATVFALWVACRVALVGPMMVDDNRFHLADAWVLTRGHAKDIFIVALCLMIILWVAEIIVVVASFLAIRAYVLGATGDPHLVHLIKTSPGSLVAMAWPVFATAMAFMIPVAGAALAFMAAPWARVLRDLGPAPAA